MAVQSHVPFYTHAFGPLLNCLIRIVIFILLGPLDQSPMDLWRLHLPDNDRSSWCIDWLAAAGGFSAATGGQETSQFLVNCDEGTYHRGLGLDDQVWWSFNNVQFWLIFCWHKICQLTHVKTSSADHQQNICFPFYFLHPPSNIIKSYIYPKTSLRLYSFFCCVWLFNWLLNYDRL